MRLPHARVNSQSHLDFNRNAQSSLMELVHIAREDVLIFPQRRVTNDSLMIRRRRLMSACKMRLITLIDSYASIFVVDTAVRYFVLWYILKKISSEQL